ncbi:MAG TPA: PilZ domain-containing protein [Geobacteraceae bacterium]|nr:PilZ domain-containing protein [Geobacteraceae bacterium]
MAEKRLTGRYPKKIPVKFGFGNLYENGETENISLTGMFVNATAFYATRTVIKIEYTLPKNIVVGINGEVRWKRESSSQWIQTAKKNGFGIRIVKFYSGEQIYKEMIKELQDILS